MRDKFALFTNNETIAPTRYNYLFIAVNIPKNNTYTSVAASLTEEMRLKLASGPSKLFTNSPTEKCQPDKAVGLAYSRFYFIEVLLMPLKNVIPQIKSFIKILRRNVSEKLNVEWFLL